MRVSIPRWGILWVSLYLYSTNLLLCTTLAYVVLADRSADVDGEDEEERGGAQKEEGADGQNPERM